MIKVKLYDCNRKQFEAFIKGKNLKEVQGEIFHSSYYVDEADNILAYEETSSWTTDVVYKIADDNINFETIDLVNKMMNGK